MITFVTQEQWDIVQEVRQHKKLSFEIPQAGSLIFVYCNAISALPEAFFF